MANTLFPANSAFAVKMWSNRLLREFVTDTELLGKMMSYGVIKRFDDLSKSHGGSIRTSYLASLENQGLIGNEVATGNEEALTYFDQDIVINQLRNVVKIPADFTIDAQRVLFDLPEDTYYVLANWNKERSVVAMLNQLAGNTANIITYRGTSYAGSDRLKITGLNAAIAPSVNSSADRHIYANNLSTDEAVAADTTATMTLAYINEAETRARTQFPYIRPISENGQIQFVCIIHTEQYNQLINDTKAANQLRDINMARWTGDKDAGEVPTSVVYSNTLILNSDKIPQGVNSVSGNTVPNSRRAVFCGRDALGLAFGVGYANGDDKVAGFIMKYDQVDVGQSYRISINGLYGMQKVQYNGIDNGVIVISTYSKI